MAARSTTDRLARIEENLKMHTDSLNHLTTTVDQMQTTLTKQRGFVAGMVFIISAVWAAVLAIVKYRIGV